METPMGSLEVLGSSVDEHQPGMEPSSPFQLNFFFPGGLLAPSRQPQPPHGPASALPQPPSSQKLPGFP